MSSNYKLAINIISVFALVAVAAVVGLLPYIFSNGNLTSPDTYFIRYQAQQTFGSGGLVAQPDYIFLLFLIGLLQSISGLPWNAVIVLVSTGAFALIALVVYCMANRIFAGNRVAAFFAAITAVFMPVVARAIILTPQNILGFLFYTISAFGFVMCVKKQGTQWAIFTMVSFITLFFYHTLSFGVLLLVSVLYLLGVFISRSRGKRLLYSVVALVVFCLIGLTMITVFFTNSLHIWEFVGRLLVQMSTVELKDEIIPVTQFPAYFGVIILAMASLVVMQGILGHKYIFRSYVLILALVPLTWGALYLVGLNFLSYRIIPYAWLPLGLLLGVMATRLSSASRGRLVLRVTLTCFLVNAVVLGVLRIQQEYNNYGRNFVLTEDDNRAIKWIEDKATPHVNVLTLLRWPKLQSSVFSFLDKQHKFLVAPDYGGIPEDSPKRSDEILPNPRGIGAYIVRHSPQAYLPLVPTQNKNNQKYQDQLFSAVRHPDVHDGIAALEDLNIEYVYLWKSLQEYQTYNTSRSFRKAYENATVAIFERS